MLSHLQLGSRTLFPTLKHLAYLNHAAISPVSTPVVTAYTKTIQAFAQYGLDALPPCLEQRELLRQKIASLLNAQAAEIAFISNTTLGVVHIACCMDWQVRDKIIVVHGEFPTNITPWQQAANEYGCELNFLQSSDFLHHPSVALEKTETLLQKGCRLLAVSAVQFQTGLRMPLEELGKLCKKYGCLFFVDAIQACGTMPLDTQKLHIDFLSCGSHKWLMALEGCGFLYIRNACIKYLKPRTAGWLSHQNGLSFLFEGEGHLRYDRPFKNDASFVEHGTLNSAALSALDVALDILLHLGVNNIKQHTQLYITQLEEGLIDLGFRSLRVAHGQSSILSLYPPPTMDVVTLQQQLAEHQISCSIPDGKLRLAPHWPNAVSEIPYILTIMKQLIRLR